MFTLIHNVYALVVNKYTQCAKGTMSKWITDQKQVLTLKELEAKIKALSDNEDTIDVATVPQGIDEKHIDESIITGKPFLFSHIFISWYFRR